VLVISGTNGQKKESVKLSFFYLHYNKKARLIAGLSHIANC